MVKLECECNYCGHKWQEEVWAESLIHAFMCRICKDENISVARKTHTSDGFGYEATTKHPDAYIKRSSKKKL